MTKSFGHRVRVTSFTIGETTRVSYWLEWYQPRGRLTYRPFKVARKATREAARRFAARHGCTFPEQE